MKKIVLSVMILSCLTFIGCKQNDTINNTPIKDSNRFVDVNDAYKIGGIEYKIYYDSKTKIVYIANAEAYRSGISVLYDDYGKPMTIDQYNKTR